MHQRERVTLREHKERGKPKIILVVVKKNMSIKKPKSMTLDRIEWTKRIHWANLF